MKFPSVVAATILAALATGAVALLQYLQGHLTGLGIPDLYMPIALVVINTVIKLVQEKVSTSEATTRGLDNKTPGYWQRVIYK